MIKIVFVDDDEKIAQLSGDALRTKGFTVEIFTAPEEAYEFICNNAEYNILISDNIMPGLNGQELIAKCFQKRSDISAILATGDDTYGIDISMYNGRVVIVSKPFKRKDLIETIDKLMALK